VRPRKEKQTSKGSRAKIFFSLRKKKFFFLSKKKRRSSSSSERRRSSSCACVKEEDLVLVKRGGHFRGLRGEAPPMKRGASKTYVEESMDVLKKTTPLRAPRRARRVFRPHYSCFLRKLPKEAT